MKNLRLFALYLMMAIVSQSYGTIIHVPDDTTTIKGGIALANTGDTVLVAPGIYYENGIHLVKNIIVGSYFLTTGDTTFIDSTIVDGDAQGQVFKIDYCLELSGFTIRNGKGNFSGGIWVRGNTNSPITITNNIITGNQCTGINDKGGGGINIWLSNTTIRNNKIIGNRSDKAGGGIFVGDYTQATISDNIISNNRANTNGGGIATDISGFGATITGNTITHNDAGYSGGGIVCQDTLGSMIRNNFISDNEAGNRGGGIGCLSSSPTIQSNTIHNNLAVFGAGLSCNDNSNPVIKENNINGNTGFLSAAIECANNSNPDITGNIIADNRNWSGGEAISLNSCSPLLRNNTFYNNKINKVIECSSSDARIINNLFVSNTGTAINSSSSNLTISNNDFYNHQGTLFSGNTPSGIGVLSQTNVNGDSCDAYANIFLDPLLADTANGNFQITWANWPIRDSTCSPVIDAGDPAAPLDPDNTIADMGAFYFNRTFKIFNQGFDTLFITQINSGSDIFTTNFDPGDNLVLPNDSLLITVTFSPTDSGFADDTLIIDNNDHVISVYLSGIGKTPVGIIDELLNIPKEFALYPAYPNPFNSTTTIKFDLPRQSFVMAGRYKYIWNANNIASGLYLIRLNAGEYNKVRKIILLR
jgi:hypothetical protein